MKSDIQLVAEARDAVTNLNELFSKIAERGIDVRVGVVEYWTLGVVKYPVVDATFTREL